MGPILNGTKRYKKSNDTIQKGNERNDTTIDTIHCVSFHIAQVWSKAFLRQNRKYAINKHKMLLEEGESTFIARIDKSFFTRGPVLACFSFILIFSYNRTVQLLKTCSPVSWDRTRILGWMPI